MTARAPGGPSRGADAPTRTTWTRDGVGAILIVLAAALAFRLIIAYSYPGTGLEFDLASFRGWASDLAKNGLHGFYERPGFHDYTPGYLYVLYLVGLVGQATGGIGDLIKLPAIFADVAIGWLVWSMAIELGARRRAAILAAGDRRRQPGELVRLGRLGPGRLVRRRLPAARASASCGGTDPERAAIWTVIAALIKPQLGILIPIVAVVTIRRALWPAEAAVEPTTRRLKSRLPRPGRGGRKRPDRPVPGVGAPNGPARPDRHDGPRRATHGVRPVRPVRPVGRSSSATAACGPAWSSRSSRRPAATRT